MAKKLRKIVDITGLNGITTTIYSRSTWCLL